MACVADRIVAAPFAIIGSIGVVGQLPNFNRLLKDKHIDYELHTAGDHKRTLTLFGENSEQGRAKFREELEATHGLFKRFVADNRAELDIDRVATGEHWHGTQALELKLVDEIKTSDDLLLTAASADRTIYKVHYKTKPRLVERLGESASAGIQRALAGWLVR
jgi:serine protease SohB